MAEMDPGLLVSLVVVAAVLAGILVTVVTARLMELLLKQVQVVAVVAELLDLPRVVSMVWAGVV
jgi:hypothetical protein